MKKVHLISWSNSAVDDLESILEYIAIDSEKRAKEIYKLIKDSCIKLENYPNIGRIIHELQANNIESYRELIVDSWRVIYKPESNQINIYAILDSRRDVEDALLKRIIKKI